MERTASQRLWAANKYLVLSHSQKIYLQIRAYLKQEEVEVKVVEALIQEALAVAENRSSVVNAYQHIWGYFKKVAEDDEKKKFLTLLEDYQTGVLEKDIVLAYLASLLTKYPNKFLEESTIFQSE